MNLDISSLLAGLLGQQTGAPMAPGGTFAPSAPAPPPTPSPAPSLPEPAPADIEVNGRQSQYKDGVLGGAFRLGRTGGNILGMIGDALLVQSGNKPVYAPRLQRAREAEALQGFSADPLGAIGAYSQIDPEGSRQWYNDYADNQRADSANEARIGALGDTRSARINDIGRRLLGTATAETYPAIKARLQSYFTKNNVQPEFDLPDTFDPAALDSIRSASVPVDKQMTMDAMGDYRAERLRLSQEGLGIRRQQVGNAYRLGTARVGIAGRNADTAAGRAAEAGRHNRVMEVKPSGKAATGSKRTLQRVLQPDGSYKYTVQ